MTLEVHAEWVADPGVWIATSEDVPGLCVQADTFDEMVEIVTALVPELLELNKVNISQSAIPLRIVAEKTALLKAA
jgi:hypothetical protein